MVSLALLLAAAAGSANAQTKRSSKPKTQSVRVIINERGYEPVSINLRRGVPARVTFLRVTEATCATEIVIPAHNINRPLPINQPVTVSFTPKRSGEINFTCGMNMMRGKMIVR